MIYEKKSIKLTLLEINTENPRFEMVGNQREALGVMISNQKNKLIKLGEDIIEHGLNPSDIVIVTPHEKHQNKFTVLEGNRRITVLKLLNNPDLISEKNKTFLQKFKELSRKFQVSPIKVVDCVVFNDEDEANRWIKLKHTGENEGIGTVTWDAQQKARFEERFEGKATYAIQVLDFLEKSEETSEELKMKLPSIPSSSLQRLLSDPDVRSVIGIEIKDGRVVSNYTPSELIKPLSKIINDLARNDFTVKEIYYKDDRANYLESFKNDELPNKSNETIKWEITTPNPPKTRKKTKNKRRKPLSITRNTIIPKSCIIHINQPRINKIYRELKDLDLRDFVNSASITFRVFFELSIDSFVEKYDLEVTNNDKLVNKVSKVSSHLKNNKHLTNAELKPVNTAVSSPNSIFSVNTFNAYVHSKNFNPIATDLKTTWDNIEPFIVKMWELI